MINWGRVGTAFVQGLEDLLVWFVRHPARWLTVIAILLFIFSADFRMAVVWLFVLYLIFRYMLRRLFGAGHRSH